LDKKAIDVLTYKSYHPEHGARAVRKVVQEMVEDVLTEKMMDMEIEEGDSIKVTVRGKEEFVFRKIG
jgi:ATP-dependent Clp protease ATP-binding subunit ClpA